MPSDRIFPGADHNFKHSADEICYQVRTEEIAKANEAAREKK